MNMHIALLRGINVGGHRKIKMDDLKSMFCSLGFEDVNTYIQSGNVVFSAGENDKENLAARIEQEINKTFGYDLPVLIRTPKEMGDALKRFPFKERNYWKGYISFLAEKPASAQINKVKSLSSDIEKFAFGEREFYSLIDKQADEKPRFSNSFVEKKFKTFATTRNLRTVQKNLELAASNK